MFSIPKIKTVESIMDKDFITITKYINLKELIGKMIEYNQKTLLVRGDTDDIEGIISLMDVHKLYYMKEEFEDIKVESVMNKNVIFGKINITIDECRNIMIKNNIGTLPILENDKVIGVLDKDHIIEHLYMGVENYGLTVKYIVEEIKEGICAIDKNGIVILWNRFMENRYGIKSEEIVGRYINDFLENTISERVLEARESMHDVYYTSKKEELYGLVHANPVFIDDEILGVVCTEVDITEAKKLSKELEKVNNTLRYLENEVKNLSKGSFDKVLGRSYKLEKAKDIAKQVSKTASSIFIFGESGTGKEVFARAIHEYSERKGQFIPVNCSAIPSELFESEFFGYESGAFTGASKKGKMGIFELARDGTVFLDEIGELPINMQAKLLRVLQEKEVQRIGGEKITKINSRIISATNRDLLDLVRKGKFREDLYYRLNVVEINLPPLRERKDDIEILIYNFLKEICEQNNKLRVDISKEAIQVLQRYSWKGNIRELKNAIETMVVLSKSDTIDIDNIPNYIIKSLENIEYEDSCDLNIITATQKLEVKIINKALEITNGNKAKAAKMLNIPRTTLYYKMNNYNII
ncbi:MAG: sigma-54 dependent transcriptional regulator PrdR [Romboutsia sp.]|uniref:sigma-54 dependent transcriptional regulator PrdR n=1 Tax=Romboutsia sp. TaxID=1965302 RepID=UPI003F2DB7FE